MAVSLPYISSISIARQQVEPTSTHIRRNPGRLVKADDAFGLGSTIHSGDIPLCTDPQLCASQPPSAASLPSAARLVDFTKAGVGRRIWLVTHPSFVVQPCVPITTTLACLSAFTFATTTTTTPRSRPCLVFKHQHFYARIAIHSCKYGQSRALRVYSHAYGPHPRIVNYFHYRNDGTNAMEG
jgi:hypothetical protein